MGSIWSEIMFTLMLTWPLGVLSVSFIGLFNCSVLIEWPFEEEAELCLKRKSSKFMFSGRRMFSYEISY